MRQNKPQTVPWSMSQTDPVAMCELRCLAVEEHKDPPSREQGSDAPGRAYSSVGEIRSAVGETDWHELEKERFAASIANRINKVALSGAFNQLDANGGVRSKTKGEVRLNDNKIRIFGARHADDTGLGAPEPRVEGLALPKSVASGNLRLNKGVIRWMLVW
jgi:hypothetical protein